MMLAEISALCEHLPAHASPADYAAEVLDRNLLAKPTRKTRLLTLKHLVSMYGLDPAIPIFRAFRRLWDLDPAARPLLALTIALARDPLLRLSQGLVLAKASGEAVSPLEFRALLEAHLPDRLSPVSLASYARNLSGSWSLAGFLSGKAKKTRATPIVTPVNAAFCLFLGHLEGLTAQRLLMSPWGELLGGTMDDRMALAAAASSRGLMVFMRAGGVVEARFPGWLTTEEEAWLHEQD